MLKIPFLLGLISSFLLVIASTWALPPLCYADRPHYKSVELLIDGTASFDSFRNIKSSTDISYVDEEFAKGLFESIRNMPELQYRHILDGCYARSHLISDYLIQMGATPQKIWILGEYGAQIQLKNSNWVRWAYHVAPVILVKTKEGTLENRVIDPSIFECGLLAINEWLDRLSFKEARVILSSHLFYKPRKHPVLVALEGPLSEEQWTYTLDHATQVLKDIKNPI